ncbi:hypothetical protein, partial [Nocardia sp. NPDC004722]
MLIPPPPAPITNAGVTTAVPEGAMAATDCANTGTKGSSRRVNPRRGDRSAVDGLGAATGGGVGAAALIGAAFLSMVLGFVIAHYRSVELAEQV